jgi:hypothetical protein
MTIQQIKKLATNLLLSIEIEANTNNKTIFTIQGTTLNQQNFKNIILESGFVKYLGSFPLWEQGDFMLPPLKLKFEICGE